MFLDIAKTQNIVLDTMEISQQNPFDFNFTRLNEIQESSFGWSFTRGDSKLTSFRKRKIQDNKNNSFLCEPYEFNMSQWRRQNNPCGSAQEALSLVPTCSEVCIGSINREGGGHRRRIGILIRRIEAALDSMEVFLRRRPKEPDGDDELERRRTRSVEFLSRFARNYLFQLRMQVMEVKRQMQISSLASPGRHTQQQLLLKKLVATHQTAVQGLQACLNQLPGSVHDSAILSKLDQLLCYVCELTSLKTHIEMNTSLFGSEGSTRQDNIKTKAENLIAIVRRKRKEREEAYQAWRQAATILAKKRFGLPSTANSKIISQPSAQHQQKLWSKAVRRGKKQWPEKKHGTLSSKTALQEGDNDVSANQLTNFEPEHKIDTEADAPLDPETALELKIIMSRMKDILRGAHIKPSPPRKPSYPRNVGLVFVTHEEGPTDLNESKGKTEEKDNINSNSSEDKVRLDNHPNEQTDGVEEVVLLTKTDSQKILQSGICSDSAGLLKCSRDRLQQKARALKSDELSRGHSTWKIDGTITYPDRRELHQLAGDEPLKGDSPINSNKEEMHSCVSTKLFKRRLTPEEQRIIKYRNRFRSYKERVREIQHTSEQLLSTVFREVADELEPCILLDKMYHLELQG